jgi:hypothetical protein
MVLGGQAVCARATNGVVMAASTIVRREIFMSIPPWKLIMPASLQALRALRTVFLADSV